MLIDDDRIDNFINEKIIKHYKFAKNVLVHTSAKSALEFLNNLSITDDASNFYPEYVFLDLNMPIMDGFQFLESLSHYPNMETFFKVIMLSASINPEDVEKCKDYPQVAGFFHKPLAESDLNTL